MVKGEQSRLEISNIMKYCLIHLSWKQCDLQRQLYLDSRCAEELHNWRHWYRSCILIRSDLEKFSSITWKNDLFRGLRIACFEVWICRPKAYNWCIADVWHHIKRTVFELDKQCVIFCQQPFNKQFCFASYMPKARRLHSKITAFRPTIINVSRLNFSTHSSMTCHYTHVALIQAFFRMSTKTKLLNMKWADVLYGHIVSFIKVVENS